MTDLFGGADPTYIGIDLSLTSTGLIGLLCNGDILERKSIESKSQGRVLSDRFDRYRPILDQILDAVTALQPRVICIEGYSMGSRGAGLTGLVEFGSLVRWELLNRLHRVIEVPPSSVKKWATGKGNCDKTPVIAALVKRYGIVLDGDDEFDAYALARMAMQIDGAEQPANQHQADAIAGVFGTPKPKKARKTKVA